MTDLRSVESGNSIALHRVGFGHLHVEGLVLDTAHNRGVGRQQLLFRIGEIGNAHPMIGVQAVMVGNVEEQKAGTAFAFFQHQGPARNQQAGEEYQWIAMFHQSSYVRVSVAPHSPTVTVAFTFPYSMSGNGGGTGLPSLVMVILLML